MKIAAHTLGCKLNYAETSHLLRQLAESGHTIVDFHSEADLYIINTCTVTAIAERKCRNAIRQAVRQNPQAQVAVIGCFAQNEHDKVASIPGVTIVLGNDQKHQLERYINDNELLRLRRAKNKLVCFSEPKQNDSRREANLNINGRWDFAGAWSSAGRTRAFVKIQDGCDYFCSYCAIPIARGRSRSATTEEVVKMVNECARSGAKEVVLTGVNTGTFGLHTGERFIDLLKRLDDIEPIARYRISSIEPNLITDEIIDFTARSRAFLPHFHIPLQAGSDNVLKLMRRHYDTALYREKTEYIKSVMPDACIAADIIAGCNGESDEDFEATKEFVESLPISYLHVFTYSERPHTAALKIEPHTDMHLRRLRSQELHAISERKLAAFNESQMGKARPVLWESDNHDGMMHGLTDNYIRLERPFDPTYTNSITTETITAENIVRNVMSDD